MSSRNKFYDHQKKNALALGQLAADAQNFVQDEKHFPVDSWGQQAWQVIYPVRSDESLDSNPRNNIPVAF